MTFEVFPELDGLSIESSRQQRFSTSANESLNGNEARIGFMVNPKVTFKVPINKLVNDANETDLITVLSFQFRMKGMLSAFLYSDPDDYRTINNYIGTGNGVVTDFQLQRSFGARDGNNNQQTTNINESTLVVYDNDVIVTNYTVVNGLLSFAAGHEPVGEVRADFDYYYLCRFTDDGFDVNRIDSYTHDCPDLSFVGSLQRKISPV